ncbi:Inactive ubiquitin carboxyl-terminal hydrolase [Actinidia chinensis var. chinensis]|uniref:Inactive ubiquitin carboxyl-terminal hydrolase n=1 Tax=Actinidia chinensis var. chinensis TaxID=1590841 RepID=A0A2R6RKA0_ACTCC|nr:Inactive ubiquitin carboxyl-terminal hydrolase [Actinidia chinensis var. chinensis]
MAPNNCNPKPPLTADTAATSDGGAPPIQEQSNTAVKLQCEQAMLPLRSNDHAEALRLIEETCLLHPNSAIAHRTQAQIHHQAASKITDPSSKQQHLQNAVVSVRRAVTLSPSSIEHVDFLCRLLLESASDAEAHKEVVRECERSLAVEDPIDPADDTTVEERIESVRVKLRLHLQKSRAALTEKGGGINEPKVKEISVQLSSESKESEKSSSSSIMPKEKLTNVPRKSIKEMTNVEARVPNLKIIAYWESMSEEKRRAFLELKISDIREVFRSLKDGSAVRVFSEAVDYADKNKTWKFWPCHLCDGKFAKVELLLEHIEKFHDNESAQMVRNYVPIEVDADWAKLLVHGTWKPVDVLEAMEIISIQSKSELGNEDRDQFTCELPKKESDVNDISKFNKILLPKACSDNQNWPLSDDIERAKVLKSIHAEFQLLVKSEYLTMENLSQVIGSAITELQNSIPASELRIRSLDRTPLCICFLGLSKLKSLHMFLKLLSGLAYRNEVLDPVRSSIDAFSFCNGVNIKERIVFTGNPSRLLDEQFLQVEFMPHRYHDATSTCKIRDDEVDVLPDVDDLMRGVFDPSSTIGELLASWRVGQENIKHQGSLYFTAFEKELRCFHCFTAIKSGFVSHKEELGNIESICNAELTKREQDTNHVPQSYISLLQRRQEELDLAENDDASLERYQVNSISSVIKGAALDEAVDISQFKTEGASDHVDEEYARTRTAILRQNERMTLELEKIHEKLGRNSVQLWRMGLKYKQTTSLDYRAIMLPLLKLFMQAKMEALVDEDERQKADAAGVDILSKLELDSKNTSKGGHPTKHSNEKSNVTKKNQDKEKTRDPKAQMEALDVEEKADAAQIAILSEHILDAKKNTSQEASPTKHPKEKSKPKKKRKDKKKEEDPKATCDDELNVVQEEKEEEPHFPADQTVGSPSSVIDELKQQEEEERKLKEMECQRLIEDEVKQKNLAKQITNEAKSIPKMNMGTVPLNLEASGSVIRGLYVGTIPVNYKPRDSVMAHQDPSLGKVPEDFSGVPVSSKSPQDLSGASGSQKNRRSRSPSKVKQAQKNLPLTTRQTSEAPLEGKKEEGLRVLPDILRAGLKNDAGEFNCFLNVIVQSLWHIRKFRDEILSRSTSAHAQVRHPCVVCALHEVLNGLSVASANMQSKAVSPSPLRVALSQLKPGSNLFQIEQQNDASEVLSAILDCLHQSFTRGSGVSDAQPLGSRKCDSDACIAHRLFELDIHIKLICQYCGTESRQQKALFDELFKLVRKKELLTCDPASLWHIRKFRDEILSRSTSAHAQVRHPCVVCALHEVLNGLSVASANMQSKAVSPSPLRVALSQLKPGSNLFQIEQQNDASEVLIAILDCLHQSFTRGSGVSDAQPLGSQKCDSDACIAHRLFEVDIHINLICQYCAQTMHAGTPFDELFKLGRKKELLTCDPAVKGCGKDNNLHHILSICPHVFTLVLGWGTPSESIDHISETLEALSIHVDLGFMFDGLDPGHLYSLISMVCYSSQHYICFVYDEREEWIMYDDAIVKVIGRWGNVILECKKRKFQPTVLFFESVE